jgi:L-2,4-diaminobutyrate decarboxylase
MKQPILNDITNFYNEYIRIEDINSFVIIYGGSTYKQYSNSDLDLLFYIEKPTKNIYPSIQNYIDDLHQRYELSKDEEVPSSNKLLYVGDEIHQAERLECFNLDNKPSSIVNKVVKSKEFLSSHEIKIRLIINAFTTPNIVIGNEGLANKYISTISKSITGLSILLNDSSEFTMDNLYDRLVNNARGISGELFLGYKAEFPEVEVKLKYILLNFLNEFEKDGYLIKEGNNYRLNISIKDFREDLKQGFIKDRNYTILNNQSSASARKHFDTAIDLGINFKLRSKVRKSQITEDHMNKIMLSAIPEDGKTLDQVIEEFKEDILPYCYNFSSTRFMGFPDAGNSIAGITGALIADFLQQNLINQSFCSPTGTLVEISVIRWLREIVGYNNNENVASVFDVGGIITGGGTGSNATAIMLARENFRNDTMTKGVCKEEDYYLIVPQGIGHYSVKSAQMWAGCGNHLLEVPTINYQYDLTELEKVLLKYKGKIMGLVAYVGDSRTMTIDKLDDIADMVREIDPKIWLHADACHGFSLGLSNNLKHKIKGIEKFDSITTDPHKVMNIPYTLSALLVKEPSKMQSIASLSDLIMQEQYAFGQITPHIGSKSWLSLKLWFAIKNIGRSGFEKIIEERHKMALEFHRIINESTDFIAINEVHINSVGFMYIGDFNKKDINKINTINKKIHDIMIDDGEYHLHQFSIPDSGLFKKGELIYPHRFMSGNPDITTNDMYNIIDYMRSIANSLK